MVLGRFTVVFDERSPETRFWTKVLYKTAAFVAGEVCGFEIFRLDLADFRSFWCFWVYPVGGRPDECFP